MEERAIPKITETLEVSIHPCFYWFSFFWKLLDRKKYKIVELF